MNAQVWLNTNLVRLQKAVLCTNCEIISEGINSHCAGCGSESLLRLSGVLGGTIESQLALGIVASLPAVSSEDVRVSSVAAAA